MAGPSKKILVVDDNLELCRNITDILEISDYRASIANDGFKALNKIQSEEFDLVLMDVKMPVMNGVETFKKIKELNPGLPVVMMTAYAVEDLIREALREGAFGCLRKPIDYDKLLETIATCRKNGGLVLVVDDDRGLCANLKDILSAKGFRVSVAYDGTQAIDKTRENNFDVLVIDLKLPPLNGLETFLAVRDLRPNITAIIVSGYLGELQSMAQQAKEKAVYECLEKPIDMDRLIGLLDQIKAKTAP